jgi:hypothetical protein
MLEKLVRRAALKPREFMASILSHRPGDDKQMYQSVSRKGAILDAEDKSPVWPDRDFLPDLIPQGYLLQTAKDTYLMKESLFRAYGFELPS